MIKLQFISQTQRYVGYYKKIAFILKIQQFGNQLWC